MSRSVRRLARKQQLRKVAPAPISIEGRGFDVSTIQLTDLDEITVDVTDDLLSIGMRVPVGNNDAHAEYVEDFDLDSNVPDYLKRAAREFVSACARAVRERELVRSTPPCASCTGACCRDSSVRLTRQDVDQLRADGVDMETVVMLEEPTLAGYVAQFAEVAAYDGHGTACPHLQADGCSIYEHRPTICREYSAWTCNAYVEDPGKKDGKVRLRVVDSAAE